VGIERSLVFKLPGGEQIRSITEAQHESQLTREHITAAVHYVRFDFTPEQVADFHGSVRLCADHPSYLEETELLPATIDELLLDLIP
jgi:hypothetical protein